MYNICYKLRTRLNFIMSFPILLILYWGTEWFVKEVWTIWGYISQFWWWISLFEEKISKFEEGKSKFEGAISWIWG